MESLSSTWAIDALRGEEEWMRKKMTEQRKELGAGLQPSYREPLKQHFKVLYH